MELFLCVDFSAQSAFTFALIRTHNIECRNVILLASWWNSWKKNEFNSTFSYCSLSLLSFHFIWFSSKFYAKCNEPESTSIHNTHTHTFLLFGRFVVRLHLVVWFWLLWLTLSLDMIKYGTLHSYRWNSKLYTKWKMHYVNENVKYIHNGSIPHTCAFAHILWNAKPKR